MWKHPDLTLGRLQRFLKELAPRLYSARHPVDLRVFAAPGRISHAEARRGRYRPAKIGEAFGPAWSTHWFRVSAAIPKAWRGAEVHLLWNSNSEACVWVNGQPRQGLSGAVAWYQAVHTEYPVTRSARGGERFDCEIEMACNGLFGWTTQAPIGTLTQAELGRLDPEARGLYWDLTVVADLARHLPDTEPRKGQALAAANDAVNLADPETPATWPAARRRLAAFLAVPAAPAAHEVSAIGHAHLDTAWLWPVAETRRKAVRTFSSALALMNEDPAFRFAASQAAQYQWIRDGHPGLWRRLRAAVKAGRFLPAGGTWVEPDCNLPSGESLVRQFLHGQRFFRREFGAPCAEFWNPDVFGYCSQLPQILRGAGIRRFLTQKLSWNQFNKFPHHTFLWEGLDGSRVLTHFPPTDTYNATPDPKTLLAGVKNFKDADRANESLLLFGYGDGGGGPNRPMLEQLRRVRNVAGLPRVTVRSPREFFDRCERDLRDPCVWSGELYFELHRGTYTSQAAIKRDNRRAEILLHDAELFAAAAHALGRARYPAARLDALWKTTLLNQFHDILPGSSIGEVYRDAARDHAAVLGGAAELRDAALRALLGRGRGWCAVNPQPWARTDVVALPAGALRRPAQRAADGRPLALIAAPGSGYAPLLAAAPAAPVTARRTRRGFVLENGHLRATLDEGGRLVSLLDLDRGREAVAPGARANQFVLFDDRPNDWDAWDVDAFHLETRRAAPAARRRRLLESGPLRATVEFEVALTGRSRLTQRVSLCAGARQLEFDTEADWHEKDRFLKVEFPWDIRCEFATYETQFGHVRRPTHANTSWDWARFEVCAHQWADLSEPGFGIALLNDGKYGHSALGNVMRLSLLRAPKMPDPDADMGAHRFRYAVRPHGGDFRAGGVIPAARAFNSPLHIVRGAAEAPVSFFQVDAPHVVLDTVKKAEDSDALIARLFEAHGARGPARLTTSLPCVPAARCNLLEEDAPPPAIRRGAFSVRPFEIVTVRLDPRRP